MKRMTAAEYLKTFAQKKEKQNKFKVAPKPDRTWEGEFRGRKQTIVFGSKLEMTRFVDLLWKQEIGVISGLYLQEPFKIGIKNRVYKADFTYFDEKEKKWVIEDAKGRRTPMFNLKWDALDMLYPNIVKKIVKKHAQ